MPREIDRSGFDGWLTGKARRFNAFLDRTAIKFNAFLGRVGKFFILSWGSILILTVIFYITNPWTNVSEKPFSVVAPRYTAPELLELRQNYLDDVSPERLVNAKIVNKYGNVWIYDKGNTTIPREHCEINKGKFSRCEPRNCDFNSSTGDWSLCTLDCSPACIFEQ